MTPAKYRRTPFAVVLCTAVILTGGACSSSASKSVATTVPSASSAATGAAKQTVDIKNFAFTRSTITVKVGATVTFVNQDDTTHTATANDKSFDTGDLNKGDSKTVTFSRLGTVHYVCSIHNYMTGTVRVVAG